MPAMPRPGGIQRVLLVSNDPIVPQPTGSGNRAIRWGLIDGLMRCGVEVGFYVATQSGRAAEFESAQAVLAPSGVRFWLRRPGPSVSADSVSALTQALTDFQPDVLLVYGLDALRIVRATDFAGLVGLMTIDLEHIPGLHRHIYNLRFGTPKQQLKSFLETPLVLWSALRFRHEVRRDYPTADFIINHAANHADWHRARHGRPTCYTPNPVTAVFDVWRPGTSGALPRFVLLGGMGGIATLTGLAWFATKVYPIIEPAIEAGELEVHLIGRGELEPSLRKSMPRIVRRGYVENLTDEMRAVTAVLVPTPIEVGFRTRILDAFRHGVTVVAHKANAAGMLELAHGRNALVAADPKAFAEAMLNLARTPQEAARLGKAAFEQFQNELNATVTAERILRFAENEVKLPGA